MVVEHRGERSNNFNEHDKDIEKGAIFLLQELYLQLTLWCVFGTVNFEAESGPPHCDASRHQKVAFYVILLFSNISPLHLTG